MKNKRISTGIDGLDEILKGVFSEGICTIITGPSGVGKSFLIPRS